VPDVAAGDWMADVDIERPSAARMYDYYLGGNHNFAADRQAADEIMRFIPNVRQIAQANRAFLQRSVEYLIGAGVRQFLDIGSGIPTVGNVHEAAQNATPGAGIVYVDTDPVAIEHSIQILNGNERATAIQADLRNPQAILAHPDVRRILDLTQPVGLLMLSMLQFIPDAEAYPAVGYLRDILASGSYLVISHVAEGAMPADRTDSAVEIYSRSSSPGAGRRIRPQIAEFFDGYDLVAPGLVWVPEWRPRSPEDVGERPEDVAILGGVARKP
jgi:hypothetical protein